MNENEKAKRRADALREQIEAMKKDPAAAPPKSPQEFIHRRMQEIKSGKKISKK